jgi:hypothetical protein
MVQDVLEPPDPESLSSAELKLRIRELSERSPRDPESATEIDALRSELVRRLRERHESGQDDIDLGPFDDDAGGSGVREPRRPRPPTGPAAIDLDPPNNI